MTAYGTTLAEGFAQRVMQRFYQKTVTPEITNNDYEGEVKDKLSKLEIMTFDEIDLRDFTGSDMSSPDEPGESIGTLLTDQQKAHYFKIPSLSKFKSWIKNPEGSLLDNAAKKLRRAVDAYNLSFYADVQAGQRKGTNYADGTVAIDADGNVTGSGTTFTAAMVGKPFKATGHSKWYRVKTYTSATAIVIEQDLDDKTATYDGGVIGAGTAYIIQAATSIQVTKDNIFGYLGELKTFLDKAEIPAEDRYFVGPADIVNLLPLTTQAQLAVDEAFQMSIKRGMIGTLQGFKIFSNEQVAGNSTDGYHCLAGHKAAITHALAFTETGIEDLRGNFGKAYKGLNIYGSKVVDVRRKALAEGYFKL